MPSTNGDGPKRAILYARVSTDEQARSGYSLAQQLEALREYATREGYEVLEEVPDPGQSGASLERPGMDRVRDLVAAGGVSVVLAQDRDRFAREPAYHYLLKREFEEHGTRMRALNDRGDESPEGEFMDGVLDQLAKMERAKIAERTRIGKLGKAMQGKVVGANARPHFGFRFNEARDAYEVEESKMPVVRRIFELVGVRGSSIYAVKKTLEAEGVPPPKGGTRWSKNTIRTIIGEDSYVPHDHDELRVMLPPRVHERLDRRRKYGVLWYNRRKTSTRQVAVSGTDGKEYRRRTKVTLRPREEWIGVPVPDAGIPKRVVEAARTALLENTAAKNSSGRFWELSGGIARCAVCGWRMVMQTRHRGKNTYYYYRCALRQAEGKNGCPNGRHWSALQLEEVVFDAVAAFLLDPDRMRKQLTELVEHERSANKDNPRATERTWLERLAELDAKRGRFQDMAAEGLITMDELRAKLRALEEDRVAAQRELAAAKAHRERLAQLESDAASLIETYSSMVPESLANLTPEERNQMYRILRLRADIGTDGEIELSGVIDVCTTGVTS